MVRLLRREPPEGAARLQVRRAQEPYHGRASRQPQLAGHGRYRGVLFAPKRFAARHSLKLRDLQAFVFFRNSHRSRMTQAGQAGFFALQTERPGRVRPWGAALRKPPGKKLGGFGSPPPPPPPRARAGAWAGRKMWL